MVAGPGQEAEHDGEAAKGLEDASIRIVEGALSAEGAVISAEAAQALGARIGDVVTVTLPDASTYDASVSGIADLSRARSLFSSRRGGDLETFIYSRNSIVVSPQVFADRVQPAGTLSQNR